MRRRGSEPIHKVALAIRANPLRVAPKARDIKDGSAEDFRLGNLGRGVHVEQVGGCPVGLHAQAAAARVGPVADLFNSCNQEIG